MLSSKEGLYPNFETWGHIIILVLQGVMEILWDNINELRSSSSSHYQKNFFSPVNLKILCMDVYQMVENTHVIVLIQL